MSKKVRLSVTIDKDTLRIATRTARKERISLSAWVNRTLYNVLAERGRG